MSWPHQPSGPTDAILTSRVGGFNVKAPRALIQKFSLTGYTTCFSGRR
jgi:hypothetical protein